MLPLISALKATTRQIALRRIISNPCQNYRRQHELNEKCQFLLVTNWQKSTMTKKQLLLGEKSNAHDDFHKSKNSLCKPAVEEKQAECYDAVENARILKIFNSATMAEYQIPEINQIGNYGVQLITSRQYTMLIKAYAAYSHFRSTLLRTFQQLTYELNRFKSSKCKDDKSKKEKSGSSSKKRLSRCGTGTKKESGKDKKSKCGGGGTKNDDKTKCIQASKRKDEKSKKKDDEKKRNKCVEASKKKDDKKRPNKCVEASKKKDDNKKPNKCVEASKKKDAKKRPNKCVEASKKKDAKKRPNKCVEASKKKDNKKKPNKCVEASKKKDAKKSPNKCVEASKKKSEKKDISKCSPGITKIKPIKTKK